MAFNPFDVFRRNQRILFAILTVIVMFMFVLSSGVGGRMDFFDWFPRWLGTKGHRGETLAVIDGVKFTQGDLNQVETRRILANTYMFSAAILAQGNLAKYVQDGASRMTAEKRPAIQDFLSARPMYIGREMVQRVMMAQQFAQFGITPPSEDEMLNERERLVLAFQNRLLGLAADPQAKPDDQEIARSALYLMDLDLHMQEAQGQRGIYFTNQPNRSTRDQIDFALWLKKADELGINFTDADVGYLIRADFKNKLSDGDWVMAQEEVRRKSLYSQDLLNQSLADEFRVRAAQTAVLGQSAVHGPPLGRGYDAPYDYYEFFKNQCSPARFGLFTVPAENYLDQVTDTPKESELLDIFKKYRAVEPNPASPAVGLREPRRLKLGWLEAKGNEPFYTAAAADALPKIESNLKVLAALTPAAGPGALANLLGIGWLLTNADVTLQAEYAGYKGRVQNELQANWFTNPSPLFAPNPVHPVEASVARPQIVATAAGAIAAGLLTGAPWPVASLAVEQAAIKYDLQGRTTALAPLLAPSLSVADVLGTVAAQLARTPQPLPLAAVRSQLTDIVKENQARRIAVLDLEKFQKDLAELGEKLAKAGADKKEAARAEAVAFVEKFVKERGLKSGGSTAFHDQFTMGEDPGLKTLKDKLVGPHGQASDLILLGPRFFFEMDPNTNRPIPTTGLFKASPYPSPRLSPTPTDPAYLVWRTDDQEGSTPRDMNNPAVKAKTVEAWKRLKAREIAKKVADRLAKECNNLGDGPAKIFQNLQDKKIAYANSFSKPEAKAKVKYFEIDNVAPLVRTNPKSNPLFPGREAVGPYVVGPSTDIPYPNSFKMTDDLLATRMKPLSSSVALTDLPEDTNYVAVLLNRTDETADDFGFRVYGAPLFGEFGAAVSRRHQAELLKQAREEAVALLKTEFRYEKENEALVNKKSDNAD